MLFEIMVALLLVLALLMIAPPLLRRAPLPELDRKQQNVFIARERLDEIAADHAAGEMTDEIYEQARTELEASLIDDIDKLEDNNISSADEISVTDNYGRIVYILLVILVPLASLGFYYQLGSPQYLDYKGANAGSLQMVEQMQKEAPSMEQLVNKLNDHLQKQPDDGDAWFMLAKTYMAAEEYQQALDALKRAYAIVGDHPSILLGMADASAMLVDGNLTGEPTTYIEKALEIDPSNTTGLWLGGMSAQQNGDFQLAVERWLLLVPRLTEDASSSAQLKGLINEAIMQAEAAGTPVDVQLALEHVKASGQVVEKPAEETATVAVEAPEAEGRVAVKVWVSIADSVSAQINPEDTLFVFAKAVSGPPMPLAAFKGTASELPMEITLDDSMAMMPQMKISNFDKVTVSARIAKGGTPTTQSGDITSPPQEVELTGTVSVQLELSEIVK